MFHMEEYMIHITCLALVAIVGYSVIWYKKNRKRILCSRMKRNLLAHPSEGQPSEYFLDGLTRKFPNLKPIEYSKGVKLFIDGISVAEIRIRNGMVLCLVFHVLDKIDPQLSRFLNKIYERCEWEAVSELMNCGIYCMK